jgi:HPt (histidine-containing phosphotransfer) domain-containing protein
MADLDVRLERVWAQHRSEISARVATIEGAVGALAAGTLDDASRLDAVRAAHRLAGTAGTFGFGDASQHAAALEQRLRAPTTRDHHGRELTHLVRALRVALDRRDRDTAPAADAQRTDS